MKPFHKEWHLPLELSPLLNKGGDKGFWVDPVVLIQVLNGWALAHRPTDELTRSWVGI